MDASLVDSVIDKFHQLQPSPLVRARPLGHGAADFSGVFFPVAARLRHGASWTASASAA
jgi:hypothetical protein